MAELKPCPQCGEVPEIGYACGAKMDGGTNDDSKKSVRASK